MSQAPCLTFPFGSLSLLALLLEGQSRLLRDGVVQSALVVSRQHAGDVVARVGEEVPGSREPTWHTEKEASAMASLQASMTTGCCRTYSAPKCKHADEMFEVLRRTKILVSSMPSKSSSIVSFGRSCTKPASSDMAEIAG